MAEYLNHVWEIDETPADVLCSDGKRYKVAGVIDVYSRRACFLLAATVNQFRVMALLRKAILKFGVPSELHTDRGKAFISKHVALACAGMEIDVVKLPGRTPEAKPFIERVFGTMTGQLFEHLPGFVGHSVAERKEIHARLFAKDQVIESDMTPEDLQEVIDHWCIEYHERVHSGIGCTPVGKVVQSPHPAKMIRKERQLDMFLSPAGIRKVVNKGIRYENAWYYSSELWQWIGMKVQIRVHVEDIGTAWVFGEPGTKDENRFLCVVHDPAYGQVGMEDAIAAKKAQRKFMREQSKALDFVDRDVPSIDDFLPKKESVLPLAQTVEYEVPEHIRKAAAAPVEDDREMDEPGNLPQVANLREVAEDEEEPMFEWFYQRYEYLLKQQKKRAWTEAEERWVAEYKESVEYDHVYGAREAVSR